ncbi:MAG: metallophosphoesterase [Candidatus Gastranaerophilales bacterium]|nr:metallophosphoesterase [Candidatus Gastranaerophilales bacterium]
MRIKKQFLPIIFLTLILSIILSTGIANPGINLKGFNGYSDTLKFAQLSDVHLDINGKNTNRRMLGSSKDLLKDAVKQINCINNIDFVIFSGDQINRPQKDDLLEFINIANNLKTPWYFAFGNHDVGVWSSFNKKKYLKIIKEANCCIKANKSYYSFVPKKGYLVVVMDPVIDTRITANGYVDKQQLKWLDEQLDKNLNSKVLIVEHHPIVEPFESKGHKIINSAEYLDLLKKHNNVIAVLSGHYHATKIKQVGNIVFISTPSLVEYPNAFRIITINKNCNKITFNFEFKETNMKDVQQLSKSLSSSQDLSAGKEKDRNTSIILDLK